MFSEKQLSDIADVCDIQGRTGNWDYDPYMQGMYNGMELIRAIVENRDPVFKSAPQKWMHEITEDGLPAIPSQHISHTERIANGNFTSTEKGV